MCCGLTTCQPLWVILCRLPEKGRKEIEEIVDRYRKGRKRNRNEREETEGIKAFPFTHTCYDKDSKPSPTLSQYQLDAPVSITKTYLYNFDPLKPHFYIVKLGFTGVYIIFVNSAKKHRLWVLVTTASTRRF